MTLALAAIWTSVTAWCHQLSKVIHFWCFGTWNLFFHSGGNFIIPTDEVIFFRGVGIPPTSYIEWAYQVSGHDDVSAGCRPIYTPSWRHGFEPGWLSTCEGRLAADGLPPCWGETPVHACGHAVDQRTSRPAPEGLGCFQARGDQVEIADCLLARSHFIYQLPSSDVVCVLWVCGPVCCVGAYGGNASVGHYLRVAAAGGFGSRLASGWWWMEEWD